MGNAAAAAAVWWNAAIREWRAKKKGRLVYLGRGRRHAELLNDTAEAIKRCAGLQSADALSQTHTHTHVCTNARTEVPVNHPRRTD